MALRNQNLSYNLATARLDPRITLNQVESEGYRAIWRKGMQCPKRINDVEFHDLNCTFCVRGFIYDRGKEIKALITSVGLRHLMHPEGRFDAGTAMVTVNPDNRISWWDSLELLDSVIRYSEVIERPGAGTVDTLRYGALEVHRLVDQNNVDYEPGVDFNVVDGKIVWVTPPPANSFYSVMYDCRPRYVLLDIFHQIRDVPAKGTGIPTKMPIQGLAKLDFMVGADDPPQEDGDG